MVRTIITIASELDRRGHYDLADRMNRIAIPIMDLYHGTNDDIDPQDLQPKAPPYEGGIGEGVYFGENPETAEFYGDNVLHRKINVQNPLVIDGAEGINYRIPPELESDIRAGRVNSILVGENVPPFDVFINGEWYEIRDGWTMGNIGRWAEDAEHDAVIFRNVRFTSGPNEEILILPSHSDFTEKDAFIHPS